jgi:hypothetical protein
MSSQSGNRLVIYAALVGNFLIAVTKFIAAGITGSSVPHLLEEPTDDETSG